MVFIRNLLDLLNEEVGELKIHLHAGFLDGVVQHVVVWTGQLDRREEVRGDGVEQRQVVVEELWQVDVDD